MKILVVEDDPQVGRFLTEFLTNEGYEVDAATDGDRGLELALNQKYDAILLDVVLPGLSGLKVASSIRAEHQDTPILMLTGLDDVTDVVQGFESGADDYVTKPFNVHELSARVRAMCRRGGTSAYVHHNLGKVHLDRFRHEVVVGGQPMKLTPMEYRIFDFLLMRSPDTVQRTLLLEKVCGTEVGSNSNAVDVHIGNLRRKLKEIGSPDAIETIRGLGFRIN